MTLLSILVPTYNRAAYLERLLVRLEEQLQLVSTHLVQVIISDNSSTDDTTSVVHRFSERNKNWIFLSNSSNKGADFNLLSLIRFSSGTYRWIIGDDDLPRHGLLPLLIDLIRLNSASLIYLPSLWAPNLSEIEVPPVTKLKYHNSSNLLAARSIHVQITFLSSWVFNADRLFSGLSNLETLEKGIGSYLIQLGWILPLMIDSSSSILVLADPCIMATSGNTGGYSILKVFLANYPRLVHLYTRGNLIIRQALIGPSLKSFMPSLVLEVRQGKTYHQPGDISGVFKSSLRFLWYQPAYWLLCVPALFLPVSILECLGFLAKTIKKNQSTFYSIS